MNWREVVVPTSYPNLFILPRGKTLSQPSEHLLRDSTDTLLKEIYHQYDYIIIDSSPVLAADDTTSLAPKIDATLFVVRLSYTSARLTRKSLELLYNRQVNVPGVILNFVDTSLPEYYYYQYSEYYNTPADANRSRDAGSTRREEAIRPIFLSFESACSLLSGRQPSRVSLPAAIIGILAACLRCMTIRHDRAMSFFGPTATPVSTKLRRRRFAARFIARASSAISSSSRRSCRSSVSSAGILLVRCLEQREYAYFTIANTMQGTINLLADIGISIGLVSIGGRVWHDRHRFGELINTALQMRRKLGAVAILVVTPVLYFMLVKNGAAIALRRRSHRRSARRFDRSVFRRRPWRRPATCVPMWQDSNHRSHRRARSASSSHRNHVRFS